jgi:hypothetical protein
VLDRRDLAPRRWLPDAAIVGLGTAGALAVMYVVVCVWRLYGRMNDFRSEAWPAYHALEHWHVAEFVRLSPAYVGSLVLRAPFLPLASLFGSGWRAAYFATALPCIVAPPILGVWLSNQPRTGIAAGRASRISPFVLYAANPIAIVCIGFGHAEDVLGATFCIAGVVLADRGRAGLSALLIGLAVVNKSWALVAVPVVFAVLPGGRRRALVVLAITVASVLAPVFVIREMAVSAGGAASTLGVGTGNLFLVPQLLFWLGRGSWIVREAHVLIVVVGAACAGAWWLARGRVRAHSADPSDAMLLLALVLFLRAALDPWDNLYYQTPFLFAVMAYEARRMPWLTIAFSIVLLLVVPPQILGGTRDLAAARYAAVAVPTIVVLALRVYLKPGAWAAVKSALRPSPRLRRGYGT